MVVLGPSGFDPGPGVRLRVRPLGLEGVAGHDDLVEDLFCGGDGIEWAFR